MTFFPIISPVSVAPIAVVNTNTSQEAASSAQTVSLPASLVSGNLLLMILGVTNTATVTTPSGWTQLVKSEWTSTGAVYYKTSDGAEGASVEVTIGAAEDCGHVTYQIENWKGTPEAVAFATASEDPPSLTPSWGSDENIYIPVVTMHALTTDASAAPSGYSGLLTAIGNTTTRGVVWAASKIATSTSENPGIFTGTANQYPQATTIAVQGA